MRIASIPYNEELRLQDLYNNDILDSGADKEFDDLLELASEICKCPIAAITFIDETRQWLKSKIGIEVSETPRDVSFCSHTILQKEVLHVKDTTLDERFKDNPFVTGGLFLRFYAGAPIISAAGYNLGSVCVIDQEPRELTLDQQKVLELISQQISKLLELKLKNKLLKKKLEKQLHLEQSFLKTSLKQLEQERTSISKELHENIAQSIVSAKYFLEIAECATTGKEEFIKKSKTIMELLISQVQDLSVSISPTTLKEMYLKDALEHLLYTFGQKTKIKSKLYYQGKNSIDPELAINMYRIIEDQLENIKLHSKANKLEVNVFAGKYLMITIRDNGTGIDTSNIIKGSGFTKMVSRVENYNGILDINNAFNGGCELSINIPLYSTVEEAVAV